MTKEEIQAIRKRNRFQHNDADITVICDALEQTQAEKQQLYDVAIKRQAELMEENEHYRQALEEITKTHGHVQIHEIARKALEGAHQ